MLGQRFTPVAAVVAGVAFWTVSASWAVQTQEVTTVRVSLASDGSEANADSTQASLSADGRFAAFASTADNLVPGDTNGVQDVFVRDRQFAETTRVSVTSHGAQAHCAFPGICSSSHPAISADGRFVAFVSSADNLVGQQTNGIPEVFVHDVLSGATVLASQSSAGAPGNEGATEGYEGSDPPAISATGRFVAFESASTNLVAGDTNRITDVFVRDLLAATTIRVSVAADGSQGVGGNCGDASISADGRFVAFPSGQSNLVPGDTNGTGDVFVRDRVTAQIALVSKPSTGEQSNGPAISTAISAEGRRVAYDSLATNLVPGDTNHAPDVFVVDLAAGRTTRVSVASDGTQGNGLGSSEPAISRDGRIVAFQSGSSNLVPGDTNSVDDVFIHEMTSKRTIRLSVASDGRQGNSFSWNPTVAAGGRMIGYESLATNLVYGDTNGAWDVFVGTLRSSATRRSARGGWIRWRRGRRGWPPPSSRRRT